MGKETIKTCGSREWYGCPGRSNNAIIIGHENRLGYMKSVDRMSRSGMHEKRWAEVTEWHTRKALTGSHEVVSMKSVDRISRSGIHEKRWPDVTELYTGKGADSKSRSGTHEKRWPDDTELYTGKALTVSHGVVYMKSVDRKSRSGTHEKRWQ